MRENIRQNSYLMFITILTFFASGNAIAGDIVPVPSYYEAYDIPQDAQFRFKQSVAISRSQTQFVLASEREASTSTGRYVRVKTTCTSFFEAPSSRTQIPTTTKFWFGDHELVTSEPRWGVCQESEENMRNETITFGLSTDSGAYFYFSCYSAVSTQEVEKEGEIRIVPTDCGPRVLTTVADLNPLFEITADEDSLIEIIE
jgi:hypothetical protein